MVDPAAPVVSVGIRRAEVTDLEALRSAPFGELLPPVVWAEAEWAVWIERDDCYIYILETSRLEGVIAVRVDETGPIAEHDTAELLIWYLRSDMRRRHMGRKLLIHAVTVAKRLQCDRLLLWLRRDTHDRGIQVATRAGFVPMLTRESNLGPSSVSDEGFVLSLEAYF